MDKLFLSDTFKYFLKRRVFVTDGAVFRMHYRVTSLVLIVCSILVSTTQFLGNPIECIQTDDVPSDVLNTYCWVEGTFSMPEAFNKRVGEEVVYPGVENKWNSDGEPVIHAYYQWVCFFLLFQAILFCMPKLLWSSWEGGRMRHLLQELHRPVVPSDEKEQKFAHLVRYFLRNMHQHSPYAFRYAVCECISLVNVIGQIYLIDVFLGGEFTTYGLEVLSFVTTEQVDRVDPMIRVFPRLTKCTFHRFGSSGTVMRYDALCLLPLNIVNEKIYIMLWFWLLGLAFMTVAVVVYRIVLMAWPHARFLDLHSTAVLTPKHRLLGVLSLTSYGDWFVLSMLANNMDSQNFREFLEKFCCNPESTVLLNDGTEHSSTA